SEIIGYVGLYLRQISPTLRVGILERLNGHVGQWFAGAIQYAAGDHSGRCHHQSNIVDVRAGFDGECAAAAGGATLTKGSGEISTPRCGEDIGPRWYVLKFESAADAGGNSQGFGSIVLRQPHDSFRYRL